MRPIPADRRVGPLIGQKLLSFMGLEQLSRDQDRLGDLASSMLLEAGQIA